MTEHETRDPERTRRGAALARALNGFRPPSPANRARCPHCGASVGNPCVLPGGARLVHVPAHHARYTAAGFAPPAVDPELVAAMRSPRDPFATAPMQAPVASPRRMDGAA